MKNKKGQEVMEFLMTYGWAILTLIIAIGLLWYFRVFNPSTYGITNEQIKCYKNYAKSFCEKNNMSFVNNSVLHGHFQCSKNNYEFNQRYLGNIEDTIMYYFIDSEINDCKNKK